MSLREAARYEMGKVNFGEDDTRVMMEILDKFFDQWDRGGAAHVAADVLLRLIGGQPLSALTGADDEWVEVGEGVFQNRRCSSVFRQDGCTYDIDVPGRPEITFPYWPKTSGPPNPVVEFGTEEA